MPVIEVEVKAFSSSEVTLYLEYGHIVHGEFKSEGKVYKNKDLQSLYSIRRDGKFGSRSYTELYTLNLPNDYPFAIAGKRRRGVGTTSIEMVSEILFTPLKDRVEGGQ